MQPSRREFCKVLGAFSFLGGAAGCLSQKQSTEVAFGQIEVSNKDKGVPHRGRVWLTAPQNGAVWEATFDLAEYEGGTVLPTAHYVEGLPEELAAYRLHIHLGDGTQETWGLQDDFATNDDCIQAWIKINESADVRLYLSGGCDTIRTTSE